MTEVRVSSGESVPEPADPGIPPPARSTLPQAAPPETLPASAAPAGGASPPPTPSTGFEQGAAPPTRLTTPTGSPASRTLPTIPGLEVIKELGRGGMGVVYLVRRTEINRLEALKMILAGDHASPADLARFKAEAQTVASLRHSSFVQIYDVGEAGAHPYIRLEYVSGGNLEDWLERRLSESFLDPGTAVGLVAQLARAMHHMHERGFIHRDLKPANILVGLPDGAAAREVRLEDCELKISDFGLARAVGGPGVNTKGLLGTPAYMAPEQATGGTVDRRADVYALGAILYRLLTGRPPHEGDDPYSVLAKLIQPGNDPVPPSQLRPDVPAVLDGICRKALEKDPAGRFATAKELAEALPNLPGVGGSARVEVPAAPATPTALRPGSASPAAAAPRPAAAPGSQSDTPRRGHLVRVAVALAGLAAVGAAFVVAAQVGYGRWLANELESQARDAVTQADRARDVNKQRDARKLYQTAQQKFEQLAGRRGDSPGLAVALARAHIEEGKLWLSERVWQEASDDFERASNVLNAFHNTHGYDAEVMRTLAEAQHQTGVLWDAQMLWGKALTPYGRALRGRQDLCEHYPAVLHYQRDLARSHGFMGDTQLQLNQRERAKSSYEDAEKLREELVSAKWDDPKDRFDARCQLARSRANWGR